MKRHISMFLMIVICLLIQTTIFPHIQLTHIMPNLLVILTSVAGFMYGRKFGMYTGFICGAFVDLLYANIIGIGIFIFVVIGYVNGMITKFYFDEDISIPLIAIAVSDLAYGFLFYICNFLLRGRLDFISYIKDIMIPEMIYTILFGLFIYKGIRSLEEKFKAAEEESQPKRDRLY